MTYKSDNKKVPCDHLWIKTGEAVQGEKKLTFFQCSKCERNAILLQIIICKQMNSVCQKAIVQQETEKLHAEVVRLQEKVRKMKAVSSAQDGYQLQQEAENMEAKAQHLEVEQTQALSEKLETAVISLETMANADQVEDVNLKEIMNVEQIVETLHEVYAYEDAMQGEQLYTVQEQAEVAKQEVLEQNQTYFVQENSMVQQQEQVENYDEVVQKVDKVETAKTDIRQMLEMEKVAKTQEAIMEMQNVDFENSNDAVQQQFVLKAQELESSVKSDSQVFAILSKEYNVQSVLTKLETVKGTESVGQMYQNLAETDQEPELDSDTPVSMMDLAFMETKTTEQENSCPLTRPNLSASYSNGESGNSAPAPASMSMSA